MQLMWKNTVTIKYVKTPKENLSEQGGGGALTELKALEEEEEEKGNSSEMAQKSISKKWHRKLSAKNGTENYEQKL